MSNKCLTDLETKYTKLARLKKWSTPSESKVDSKYMSLLATKKTPEDSPVVTLLQKILLSGDSDPLRQALLESTSGNGNCPKSLNGRHK